MKYGFQRSIVNPLPTCLQELSWASFPKKPFLSPPSVPSKGGRRPSFSHPPLSLPFCSHAIFFGSKQGREIGETEKGGLERRRLFLFLINQSTPIPSRSAPVLSPSSSKVVSLSLSFSAKVPDSPPIEEKAKKPRIGQFHRQTSPSPGERLRTR